MSSQIHILISGAFAGALGVALTAYCEPAKTKTWVDALGAALAIPVLLLIGINIHLLYRFILGEWVLYPVRDFARWLLDIVGEQLFKRKAGHFSYTRTLALEHVPFGYRRLTYSAIRGRDGVLNQDERQHLDVRHAIYAFLYLSALEFLVAAVYRHYRNQGDWRELALFGGISLVGAFVVDFKQDLWECRLIRRDLPALRTVLCELGFAPGQDAAAQAPTLPPRAEGGNAGVSAEAAGEVAR